MSVTEPVVIQCAVTGSQPAWGKDPNLPATPHEIADSAVEAAAAGAAMVHIHARTEDGTPSPSLERFREIVERIREQDDDVMLNLSTGSGGGRSDGSERYECLQLDPEFASFDCGTLNFGERIFENPLPFLREMSQVFAERNIRPEVEWFEAGHIETAHRLRDDGHLSDPLHFQFVLGVPGGAPGTIPHAEFMRPLIDANSTWSVCGVGRAQLPLNLYALAAGGHVRTGMEDNLYFKKGELAKSNAQLVERVVRIAEEADRAVATPRDARRLLAVPD